MRVTIAKVGPSKTFVGVPPTEWLFISGTPSYVGMTFRPGCLDMYAPRTGLSTVIDSSFPNFLIFTDQDQTCLRKDHEG